MPRLQHILVATDGSEHAERAVAFAATLAQAAGAELGILTSSAEPKETGRLARAEGDVGAALDAFAEQLLSDAEAIARRAGATNIKRVAGWGDPAEMILDCARDAVDLVVLGRRGRGRLAGLLLGSVSQKVVSLAPCAVAIVP